MMRFMGRAAMVAVMSVCGFGASRAPLFLTATNGATNYLAVINTATREASYLPTGGSGGASGNANSVAVEGRMVAVANFGTSNVTVFVRRGESLEAAGVIQTASAPVSVAFGHGHLVVLGQMTAESFPVYGETVGKTADGSVRLMKADKSAAQIAVFDGGVVYVEKSGGVALLDLPSNGFTGLAGPSRPVTLPAAPDNDTPFGMIARGANIYLTIAHSGAEVLISGGKIISSAVGPVPYKDADGKFLHAPCWNTLHGQFLYSADSSGKQLLRFLVSDTNVFYDRAAVATFSGGPTDLAAEGNLLGVIDGGDGTGSNVSLFAIDAEGGLTRKFAIRIPAPINGAAIMR